MLAVRAKRTATAALTAGRFGEGGVYGRALYKRQHLVAVGRTGSAERRARRGPPGLGHLTDEARSPFPPSASRRAVAHCGFGVLNVEEYADAFKSGYGFLQDLKSFSDVFYCHCRQTGDVPAGHGQVVN